MKDIVMKDASLRLIEHVRLVIDEYDDPLTLRQIYYQLFSRGIIENTESDYRKLSRLCTIARYQELLNEDKFIDRTRILDKAECWDDPDDYLTTVRDAYRQDYWIDQPYYQEIWGEKDALRSIMSVTREYGVPLQIVRGQMSTDGISKTFHRFVQKLRVGKQCCLYYFGDLDPSGLAIYNSIVTRVNDYRYPIDVSCHRVGITLEQVQSYDLPMSSEAKVSDPNYRKFVEQYGDYVVELDALPPDVLRGLIRSCIERHIDQTQWELSQEKERADREKLSRLRMPD